jgi:hypothetical protein
MADEDLLELALATIRAADEAGVTLRLFGGLAVRHATPLLAPRQHGGQDIDFAALSAQSRRLTQLLVSLGYHPDERFNALVGHRQLYFQTPDGASGVDVVLDKLAMCHTLDFARRLDRHPVTLDLADLLLSKLQVVELNDKDLSDCLSLLASHPVAPGDEPGTIGEDRVAAVLAEDWGWYRTATANLERISAAEVDGRPPAMSPYDPRGQAAALRIRVEAAPKSRRWRLRARVGERMRWYELPEEVAH